MVYASELTPLLQWAKEQCAEKVIDGLGMRVGYAAESFQIWRGTKPESKPSSRKPPEFTQLTMLMRDRRLRVDRLAVDFAAETLLADFLGRIFQLKEGDFVPPSS